MVKHSLNTRDPAVRDMLIEEYNKLGIIEFEKKWEMPGRTVRDWKKLKMGYGSTKPRFSHHGPPRVLTSREVKRIEQKLISDPYATNADLAAHVKNKISAREAGRIINESKYNFRWLLEQEDVEASFTASQYEAARKWINTNKHIPLDKRIYMDETRISSRVRRRKGRFPEGKQAWSPKNTKYPGHVVVSAIKNYEWLHPGKIYKKGGLTTEEFEEYVENVLVPLIEEGDVVFWDRWGRSGRAKNPIAHHFSTKARELIVSAGGTLKLLPPNAKHLSPIEPVFGETKRIFDKKMGRLTIKMQPSKIPFETKSRFWHEAEGQVSSATFRRAYAERANGKELKRVAIEKGIIEK